MSYESFVSFGQAQANIQLIASDSQSHGKRNRNSGRMHTWILHTPIPAVVQHDTCKRVCIQSWFLFLILDILFSGKPLLLYYSCVMNGYMLNFETSPLLSWCDANLPHRARHSSSVIDAGCGPQDANAAWKRVKKGGTREASFTSVTVTGSWCLGYENELVFVLSCERELLPAGW